MIKTLDALTTEFTDKFGGDKSDAFIEFLENMTDTINDMSSKNEEVDERIAKIENDWRDRYIKRFTTVDVFGSPKEIVEVEEKEEEKEKTIDDLFDE